MNYLKTLFSSILIYFSVMGWCSNNLFMVWLMMEFSFLFFMGFISVETNYGLTELMIKYFIVQVFISLMLISLMILFIFNCVMKLNFLLIIILFMKLGMFPFQFWIIMILGKLSWVSFFYMMTFLKLIPMLMLYYLMELYTVSFFLLASSIVGSVFGVGNLLVQKLMCYSSLVHLCWMLMSLCFSFKLFYFYFFSYFIMNLVLICFFNIMNIFYVNQFKLNSNTYIKFFVFFFILSLAGFPPMMGFMMKWIVMSEIYYFNSKFIMLVLVLFSLFSVVFYLQLFFYVMMLNSIEIKWYKFSGFNNNLYILSFFILTFYLLVFFFI